MPDTLATLSTAVAATAADAGAARHTTLVPAAHDDVAQSTDATLAVDVGSVGAKARPLSVAVSPPEYGPLPLARPGALTTGAEDDTQNKIGRKSRTKL